MTKVFRGREGFIAARVEMNHPSLSEAGLCHAMRMEKKPPTPDPNSKFAEVKRKAAEMRAKKQSAREEQNRRAAEQVPRELDEGEEA